MPVGEISKSGLDHRRGHVSDEQDHARQGVRKVQRFFEKRQESREGPLIDVCDQMDEAEDKKDLRVH